MGRESRIGILEYEFQKIVQLWLVFLNQNNRDRLYKLPAGKDSRCEGS